MIAARMAHGRPWYKIAVMILVRRPELNDPEFAARAQKTTHELIERVVSSRGTGRSVDPYEFRFRPEIKRLRPRLADVFHQKCAYCESPIGPTAQGEMRTIAPRRASPKSQIILGTIG